MKTHPTQILKPAFFGTLLIAPLFAAPSTPPSTDPAAERLAAHGSVPVANVTRHVERGTFRIHVAAKLGRPDAVLPDGTWLYAGRRIEGSEAKGTLVVRFEQGRVSSLKLVTPAVATAMLEEVRSHPAGGAVAIK